MQYNINFFNLYALSKITWTTSLWNVLSNYSFKGSNKVEQESRSVAGKPRDAAVNLNQCGLSR